MDGELRSALMREMPFEASAREAGDEVFRVMPRMR